jgi:ribonuclease G
MAKEICISSTPHETRLAILEDDQLAEIYYERENEYTLAGSIYNGRVTRVLPGMQSAFVDVGLERDAFLYVTDFMELADSEETDELEKAAVSGAGQAPREVRHTAAKPVAEERPEKRREGRGERAEKPERADRADRPERSEQKDRSDRPDRSQRERRNEPQIVAEPIEIEPVAIEEPVGGEENAAAGDEMASGGGRRWRGRRRRGRGRGAAGEERTGAVEASDASEPTVEYESEPESETTTDIHASASVAAEVEPVAERFAEPVAPAPRPRSAEPVAFVMPGESLSKYGGKTADETPKPEVAAPVRPSGFAKPSTLIETPIVWSGEGLLPGESLSLHRQRGAEAEEAPAAEVAVESGHSHSVEEVEFVEEAETSAPAAHSPVEFVEELVEEELKPEAPAEADASASHHADASASHHADASASHHVDPTTPSGFRLFGFGKKKEGDEEEAKPAGASVAKVSAYAPGAGTIEEELIEGEEYEVVSHSRRHKADDHDTADYEEQTMPARMRTGDLGEMLQEAHLDHRIQLNFEDQNGEDEGGEGEEEDEATGEAPAGAPARRGERGGRGRRGRAQQPPPNNRRGPSRRSMQTSDLPVISDLLKPGQEILVQIAKEPIAKKGARITSHIALPGRFLVFMPTVSHVGVSRKIESDEERHRLKKILIHERGEAAGGFIVRTAAEGASEEELRADLRFLLNLWNEIKQRSDSSKSPALIYHDLSLIERILRDQVSTNFSNIWVDSEADYERIVRFLNRFSPTLVRRVKLYTKEVPLFEHFGIQDEISKALRSKVWLKSGGSIVINQTEALVAIDINTGKYVGKSARLEDTIVKTNLDAVPEIVRQIRLRDLGGIIVIDFIDMDERKNRFKVLAALEEALKNDRAPTKVLQFNDFGLVAITRKRVKQSLERTLSVPCPTCQATGMVKSPATVCNEIYIELRKMKKHFENADVLIRVNPETVKALKSNNAAWLAEFEELTGKNVLIKSDATLHPEQFDIQG